MSEVPHKKKVRSKKSRNAPQELSTSKPCGRKLLDSEESHKITDPRFREECGEIDKVGFVKNYAFLQKNREQEISQMQKELEDDPTLADDPEFKKRLQSLKDQHKTMASKIDDVNASIQWHREERQRIAEGKRPFWMGKQDMKLMQQKKKFDELQSTGRLNAYLKKRNKKLLAKDKKSGII
ncbi:hypothetical protein TVAG_330960 [Trichomonas vaginalis G3]|uniref:rRNA biogenesis protein RRP36 n=1 Tax=Trichomonas vaginalis (strain ATCC PRA-98 / G3) TaxID=412133 RepID=A2GHX7_TRIV3|nr:cleavage involved in rRNA processing [Trichomonas vaginalis G3]EAX83239.1 hypothetical protein TVAG_330960 [Trichomonas vaginalis G3]KAI5493437.1 cleavage involved in rRNA processing [Trichomonas vaginalis G3]|eukprot:XP_001296169.1 hypothetical protein [Trichomonas vaginalis G3]